MPETGTDRTARAAYAASVLNLAAAIAMVVLLRRGLPGGGSALASRHEYVHSHVLAWRVGWLTWNAAAISLLALYAGLGTLWRERAPLLSRLALMCAAAGLAADLGAESVLAIVSPHVSGAQFHLVERISIALTGYLGNGLYTIAGIALTIAGRRTLPRALLVLGAIVWASGIALSVATLVGSTGAQLVATAVVTPAFVLWAAGVGRWRSRVS